MFVRQFGIEMGSGSDQQKSPTQTAWIFRILMEDNDTNYTQNIFSAFPWLSRGTTKFSQQQIQKMKEHLLFKNEPIIDNISLKSEKTSARNLNYSNVMNLSPTKVKLASRSQPSQNALKMLNDKANLLKNQKYGLFRWLLQKYSRFDVLVPERTGVLIWSIVNLTIIFFYLYEIGFLIGFGDEYWRAEVRYFYFGNIFFVAFFLADIVISPLKAYYQQGILVENRVIIFKRYIRLYLWFDLLSLLGVLMPLLNSRVIFNFFKFLFLFKLITAYQLDKYLMMLIRNRFKRSHYYAVGRIVFFMLLWSHWMAVGYYALDNWIYQNNIYGPNTPNYCWIYNSGLQHNISQEYWGVKYLYALYWSIGNITTIAYGDITAYNPIDATYVIIIQTISILLFTYFFKMLLEVILVAQADQIEHQQSVTLIRRYLRNNQVGSFLETKIKSYFQISWEEQRFRNRDRELQFIEKLPKQLKEKLNISMFGDFILQLGVLTQPTDLNHVSNKTPFIFQLSGSFQFQRITAGQILYQEGQNFEEHQYIYYCDKIYGDLAITLGQGKIVEESLKINALENLTEEILDKTYLKTIKVATISGIFGHISFFTRNRRNHWAICNSNVELIKLSRSKLDELVQSYASELEKERIFITAEQITKLLCYICGQKGHSFYQCPLCSYFPGEERLLRLMKEKNQRENSNKIKMIREGEKERTSKFNAWRVFRKNQTSLDNHLNKSEWSHEESSGDDSFRQDFMDELFLLRSILSDHWVQTQKGQAQKLIYQFDTDIEHSFLLYHPEGNMEEQIKKCNIFLRGKSEQKKKDKKQSE